MTKDGFDIGSMNSTLNDVVSNGVATLQWNPSTHTSIVTGKESFSSFFASIAAPHAPGIINVMEIEVSDPEKCSPYFAGDLKLGTELTVSPTELQVFYNCSGLGQLTMSVTLGLKSYFPAQWTWTKVVGGINEQLQVGLTPKGMDIVSNGLTTLAWSSALHSHIFSDQNNVTVYLQLTPFGSSLTPPQTVNSITISGSPAGCNPQVLSPSTFPFDITSLRPVPVTFLINCVSNGSAVITATLNLASYSPVSFSWTQKTTAFIFLQVGTHKDGAEGNNVVANGKPSILWDPRFHLMTISGSSYSDFWISLSPDGSNIVSLPAPTVSVVSQSVNLTTSIAAAPTGNLTSVMAPQLIRVSYNCSSQTTVAVELTIDLHIGFAPIVIGWTKRCGGYMEFVMVATKPGFSDVVQST